MTTKEKFILVFFIIINAFSILTPFVDLALNSEKTLTTVICDWWYLYVISTIVTIVYTEISYRIKKKRFL